MASFFTTNITSISFGVYVQGLSILQMNTIHLVLDYIKIAP